MGRERRILGEHAIELRCAPNENSRNDPMHPKNAVITYR